jgi:hypothetical protein
VASKAETAGRKAGTSTRNATLWAADKSIGGAKIVTGVIKGFFSGLRNGKEKGVTLVSSDQS